MNNSIGIYLGRYQSGALSQELQTVVSKAISLGYTIPTATQLASLDAFIRYLKSNNLWNTFDCLWVRLYLNTNVGNFALLNLKNPNSYQSVLSGTPPSYGLYGYTGNGTSAFINNVFVPFTNGVNFTQNSGSIIIGSISSSPIAGVSFGGANDAGLTKRLLIEPFSGTNFFEVNTATAGSNTPSYADAGGLWIASRTASNLTSFYQNGASITTSSAASTGVTANSVYEMAENNNGTATLFNSYTHWIYGLASGWSSGQVTTFQTGVNNYLKTLLEGSADSVVFPVPSTDSSFSTFNAARISVKNSVAQPTLYNATGVYNKYGSALTVSTSHIGGCIIGGRYIYHTPWNSTRFIKTDTY